MRTRISGWAGVAAIVSLASVAVGQLPEPPLTNKTLVAWVAPANLTQRGGSALTIEDGSDHFDGIVLGELAVAKWMAGSDMFSRTTRDQSKFRAETVAEDAFVQIAIVYEGREITVYRDGQHYSRHSFGSALQEFGPRSVVVMGKRHRRQSDNAHFAGAIDDARIYDRALTADQIAALKPNTASDIKPWAWWTFDGDQAQDLTGRFSVAQLSAGAKLSGGRLILDGKTGAMICKSGKEPPFAYETPARPANPPSNWLTYHLAHPGPGNAMPGDPNCAFQWNGRYHLH
jgi:hypothetical protein